MNTIAQAVGAAEMDEKQHPITVLLREIRETLGMTQDQLAKRIGVDKSTVAQYETGNRRPNPTWDFLNKLVTRLGCDPRLMFPDHGQWPEPEERPGNGNTQ